MKLNKKMESMLKAKGFTLNEGKWIKEYKVKLNNTSYMPLGIIYFSQYGEEITQCGMWKQKEGYVVSLPSLERIAFIIRDVEEELDRLWME